MTSTERLRVMGRGRERYGEDLALGREDWPSGWPDGGFADAPAVSDRAVPESLGGSEAAVLPGPATPQ